MRFRAIVGYGVSSESRDRKECFDGTKWAVSVRQELVKMNVL